MSALVDRIAEVLQEEFMAGCTAIYDPRTARRIAQRIEAELQLTETVRLLHSAAIQLAGAVAEDHSGEPWLMTRTLLNECISRVDALGGWPQTETVGG